MSSPSPDLALPVPSRDVNDVKPILRWAGGKRWLAPLLAPLVSQAARYLEPFLGGAALFLAGSPSSAVLGDSNVRLIDTYTAVRDHPDAVIGRIRSWSNSSECYYDVRSKAFSNAISRAAQFIYLNRTCWNGLYRVNKQGQFNVPYGNNPDRQVLDVPNFLRVSSTLAGISLRSGDFTETLADARPGDFVYLDPPYAGKNQNGFLRYTSDRFYWKDQERLAEIVHDLVARDCEIVISNADCDETNKLFGFLSYHRLSRRSLIAADAASRRPVGEALYTTPRVSTLIREQRTPDADL